MQPVLVCFTPVRVLEGRLKIYSSRICGDRIFLFISTVEKRKQGISFV